MPRALGVLAMVMLAAGASLAGAQVELDHILVHVNGRIVTQSDVREARLLKLVDDVTSDEAIERALENRLLVLAEIARSATPLAPVTDDELAARQRGWESALGGSEKAAALLGNATMSEGGLQTWFRDDLRIRAYLARQFNPLPAADRAKATADWLLHLRQRAGLP